MKRLLKNKKALSPVVAAIILIAVTVAVSIAVAAWMGSLTIGFMETAEVTSTGVTFTDGGAAADTITISLTNSGTSAATISSAKVNGVSASLTSATMEAGTSADFALSLATATLVEGNKYSIAVFGNDGTLLTSYTATCIF